MGWYYVDLKPAITVPTSPVRTRGKIRFTHNRLLLIVLMVRSLITLHVAREGPRFPLNQCKGALAESATLYRDHQCKHILFTIKLIEREALDSQGTEPTRRATKRKKTISMKVGTSSEVVT
jgi:hypothetical protein